jgi:hypothetical protein
MSDRLSEAFDRALDEAGAKGHAPDDGGLAPTKRPRIGAGVPLGSAPPSGGEARFGLALEWTDEPLDRPQAPPAAPREDAGPPADTPAEIAAELGLGAPLGPAELASRWRDFVWRHHPDRQPLEARDRANARVAIANTLYQQARRALARQR